MRPLLLGCQHQAQHVVPSEGRTVGQIDLEAGPLESPTQLSGRHPANVLLVDRHAIDVDVDTVVVSDVIEPEPESPGQTLASPAVCHSKWKDLPLAD